MLKFFTSFFLQVFTYSCGFRLQMLSWFVSALCKFTTAMWQVNCNFILCQRHSLQMWPDEEKEEQFLKVFHIKKENNYLWKKRKKKREKINFEDCRFLFFGLKWSCYPGIKKNKILSSCEMFGLENEERKRKLSLDEMWLKILDHFVLVSFQPIVYLC